MGDEYIREVVRKGAEAIRRWREEHPNAPVMLVGLDLNRINLTGADLSRANLTDCNLLLAMLNGADLREAKLARANLHGANLAGANLSDADLHGAILTQANLKNADLRGADLQGADLHRANLAGALLAGTSLEGADLTGAILPPPEQADLGKPHPLVQEAAAARRSARLGIQLGFNMTVIEAARLLKALDDVHVCLGLGPVRIEEMTLSSSGAPPGLPRPGPQKNRLVVRFDPAAAEWLCEAFGIKGRDLFSPQARLIWYKRIGITERAAWQDIGPLLGDAGDPLGTLHDLAGKGILTAMETLPAETPRVEGPTPPARPPEEAAPAPVAVREPEATGTAEARVESVDSCFEKLADLDWRVRAAAAEWLGQQGKAAQAAMPCLMKAAEDENVFVREAAKVAIRKMTGPP